MTPNRDVLLRIEVPTLDDAVIGAVDPTSAFQIVRVIGEVDVTTADQLAGALRVGLEHGTAALVLDATAVTFCGVAGLAVFADAASRAAELDVDFIVAGLSPRLAALYTELWSPPHPSFHRDLRGALATLARPMTETGSPPA